ncbi:MAG TPA: hypothetical protein VJ870_14705 [Amycolatopsis sp.]|nr:hypothetical protein [Amycolatopsis sp.]
MREQRDTILVLLAGATTITALCSVPLIIEAGGTPYRWVTLVASAVLAVVFWVAYARRKR